MDGLSLATAVFAFAELAKAIKESIEKVDENKEHLAALKQEVLDAVKELESLAKEHGDNATPTGELKTALENLTEQLETINVKCHALTQSKGIPAFVKAWFKRDKIETEIKKLKENRTNCYIQFQLLSLTRVEGHAARTETKADQLISSAREEKIRKWFRALDMREKQRATHSRRHKRTGSWFLTDTKFASWKEEPGCLWIQGHCELFPCRSIHKCLISGSRYWKKRTPSFGIAYFFFDFRDKEKQLPESMLRSIIMQLSEQSPQPYSVLDQEFKSCQGGIFPTYDNLVAMFKAILCQFTATYIVLDALDECSEPDELVQFISTLRGRVKAVHLLVASQPRTVFLDSPALKGASVVLLEPKKTHADILEFVTSQLELNELKHVKKVKDAAAKIVDKSNGMFRMAACLLQELTRASRINPELGRILDQLPNDLFGIYTRFLEPIHKDDFVYVTTLLRWVAFSARPVTRLELEDALAIDSDRWLFEPEDKGRLEALWDSLEGLVIVGPVTSQYFHPDYEEQSAVTLAHSSVADYIASKEFLEEYKHDLRMAPSHTFLAQSCVAYLLHFEDNPLNADTFPRYPLARYAAMFWSHHLRRCHDRSVLKRSTTHLLQEGSQQFVALNCMHDIDQPWKQPDWSRHAPSPLSLCSSIGYTEGVQFLLGNDVTDVEERGSALRRAAKKGHVDTVRFLLENAADMNMMGGKFGSALQSAARNGNTGVVRALFEYGADAKTAGGELGSALEGAARNGHVETVRLFLEHGADMNATGALQCAVLRGHVDTVRLLLEHGADANSVGGRDGSALQIAALNGHVDILCSLIEHGTDVNTVGGRHGSALQNAALNGHVDIVYFLLEHGAEVNALGGTYGNALQNAVWGGHIDIVRILLKHGADVNAAGGRHGSALQIAALIGNVDIIYALLEHGADTNAVGGNVGGVLQRAARNGHVDTVRILLEHGADVNAAGGMYGSALQRAAPNGHVDVVRILLEYGADVNAAGGGYGSALQGAARYGHENIVRILVEHGADVNAAGRWFGSALQPAARSGHIDIVRFLLEHGADANTPGGIFGSALQNAAQGGHVDIVRLLLERGANVNATGGKYSSALDAASAGGHNKVAKLLREHGA
ncbi:ankyrin repeat-containing domain protein, partial [Mycena polygramma]